VAIAKEETYDVIKDTNLKFVFLLIQAAIPHLEKNRGNIVNISFKNRS
jgi:NAD(P)-dependent dehydrogenase (short-subunit alcohol dehydrogenase family)